MNEFVLALKIVGDDKIGYGFRIPPNQREWYNNVCKHCVEKNNGWAMVNISPPKRKRSTGKNSQNSHLNGHIQQIAGITGQPFGDIKGFCKTRAIDRGYPMLCKEDGSSFLNVWGEPQGISESDASVEDCKLLIEQIHQLAAEMNIKLREE